MAPNTADALIEYMVPGTIAGGIETDPLKGLKPFHITALKLQDQAEVLAAPGTIVFALETITGYQPSVGSIIVGYTLFISTPLRDDLPADLHQAVLKVDFPADPQSDGHKEAVTTYYAVTVEDLDDNIVQNTAFRLILKSEGANGDEPFTLYYVMPGGGGAIDFCANNCYPPRTPNVVGPCRACRNS